MATMQGETKKKPVAKIQGSPSQSLMVSSTEAEDLLGPLESLGSDMGRKSRKEAMVRATHHRDGGSSSGNALDQDLMTKMSMKSVDLKSIDHAHGFLLVDEQEVLQVKNPQEFIDKLHCNEDTTVKVVSIFGNTGDGKSHTLNHTFYGGQEIFNTSALQESCTIGIWAAMDTRNKIITIDTEGLLGVSPNENQRTRLLLKVLAISDVVIYRTRADRLHRDLFQFLGDASKAYLGHFTPELQAAQRAPISPHSMGPAVIVFHETTHTLPLGEGNGSLKAADTQLQERFKDHGFSMAAFSCVQYVGTQTVSPPTDFTKLQKIVKETIENSAVRSPRSLSVIYQALVVLNEKFSGDIDKAIPSTFPDEYFTCSVRCMSCNQRCCKTMNHIKDDVRHIIDSEKRCQYQHQYDNKVFICKTCYERGVEVVVVPKASSAADGSWYGLVTYAWSGYVLECKNCGIIYRSRQHWYGNMDPEITAVRTEIRHVWPGGQTVLQGTHNAARKFVDGISYVADTVQWVGAKPTKMVTQWMTDQIAPPYWTPNSLISNCHKCRKHFDTSKQIHHCRACGEGFCDDCSEKTAPVPERGWGDGPVRVCDDCYAKKMQTGKLQSQPLVEEFDEDGKPVTARKVGEVVQTTFSVLGSAVQYPLGLMVDAARPAYWIPDNDIIECCVCKIEFTPKIRKHHCRACGHGVCNDCSKQRRSVPSRGWDEQVRVCDTCNKKTESL
ncbi:zinc finger FYVE domain-containing protein 1-like [Amphiura filiformis]|uniref:zinc finger FYVE domain-containing protein 1-like n=1 Tax=Amphiura filiformis TaxID=82378 RepID=UPI003B21A914